MALRALADLVRLPNLFTAPPDVLVGAALLVAAGASPPPAAVAGLAGASVLLYAGGTALNDAFDAPADERARPERPIPRGDASRRTAFALGGLCLLGGVGVAALAAGAVGGGAAGAVALAVLAYDGWLKGTGAGFLAMGTARGLNVLLGATAAGTVPSLPAWALAVPAAVLVYVALLTYMAEGEDAGADPARRRVAATGAGVALAAAAVGGVLAIGRPAALATGVAVACLVGFLGYTGRGLRPAYADPRPGTVGPAVGACVLGLVLLDAALAAALAGPAWGVAAVALLVPARGLARVVDVS